MTDELSKGEKRKRTLRANIKAKLQLQYGRSVSDEEVDTELSRRMSELATRNKKRNSFTSEQGKAAARKRWGDDR